MLSCKQREIIVSVQQMIDSDIVATRQASLNLNTSWSSIESKLFAQESAINRTLSTLVADFAALSDTIREYFGSTSDRPAVTPINLPQTPRTRLAATFDDLQRLGVECRRELNIFGAQERSVWKRLIGDELTRRFYERLRSDVASFSAQQLREFAGESSQKEDSSRTSNDWTHNYELDDYSPEGVDDQLASVEARYALLNADVPAMEITVVDDQVTRELTYYADALDLDMAIKVKVEDLLTNFDDLTSNVETLTSECGPLSDNDLEQLVR